MKLMLVFVKISQFIVQYYYLSQLKRTWIHKKVILNLYLLLHTVSYIPFKIEKKQLHIKTFPTTTWTLDLVGNCFSDYKNTPNPISSMLYGLFFSLFIVLFLFEILKFIYFMSLIARHIIFAFCTFTTFYLCEQKHFSAHPTQQQCTRMCLIFCHIRNVCSSSLCNT